MRRPARALDKVCQWTAPEPFLLTYGDDVADIDIQRLLEFHKSHGRLATVTAVRPPARFGDLELDGHLVTRFSEKPQLAEGWINGGFFVLEPGVIDYIGHGDVIFERGPMESLARDGQLAAFRHEGFWQCMDTCAMPILEWLMGEWKRALARFGTGSQVQTG